MDTYDESRRQQKNASHQVHAFQILEEAELIELEEEEMQEQSMNGEEYEAVRRAMKFIINQFSAINCQILCINEYFCSLNSK